VTRDALAARIRAAIEGASDASLVEDVVAYQEARIPAYARLCAHARARGETLPAAVPTDVFRVLRLTSFDASEDVRVFRTSGTTSDARGTHPFRDLSLYDHAARAFGKAMFFPDVTRMRVVALVPSEREVTDSSLGYMVARFAAWFGTEVTWAMEGGAIDADAITRALSAAERDGEKVALLGTSFAFVHAEEALAGRRFSLPPGSRIMQTGGFKGRSRTFEPDEMRALLTARFGVPDAFVISEYGMTELSSQLWESTLRETVLGGAVGPRRLIAPPWLRCVRVDPATLAETGGEGIFRLYDPVNLDSISAIQTSDRVIAVADGFRVLGRVEGATPRGCSLAADALLGGAR
jgi:hypothetical protein